MLVVRLYHGQKSLLPFIVYSQSESHLIVILLLNVSPSFIMRGFRYVLSLVLTICCLSLTANAVCVRNICIPDIPNPNAPPTKCLPAPLAPPIETANPTVAAISTANARLPSSTTTPRFRRAEAAETCYYPTGFLKNVLVEGGTSPLIVLPVGQYKMRWVPLVKDKSLEREGGKFSLKLSPTLQL